jgi:hypothetical protein
LVTFVKVLPFVPSPCASSLEFFYNEVVVSGQGSTKVALYGLGNIRDERLNRMFQVCCMIKLSTLTIFTLNSLFVKFVRGQLT